MKWRKKERIILSLKVSGLLYNRVGRRGEGRRTTAQHCTAQQAQPT